MRPGLRSLTAGAAAALVIALFAGGVAAQDQPATELSRRPPPGSGVPVDTVVLQGLDKITARISTFEASIDQPVRFGSLEITARTCHKTPPEEPPERAAFLDIVDVRPDSPSIELFTGWMFASSPALSSLEHPVYDVWVVDCKLLGDTDQSAETPASDRSESGQPALSESESLTIEMEPESDEPPED